MKTAFGVLIVLCLMGAVGHMDYEDAVAAEQMYCKHLRNDLGLIHKRPLPEACKKR